MPITDELTIRIKADGSQMTSGLRNAQGQVDDFSSKTTDALKRVGIAAAGMFGVQFFRNLAQAADRLDKLSSRLGTTVEDLSRLRFAAQQSGISFETLTMAMQRMGRRVSEAAQGTGEAVKALGEMNINARELTRLDPAQQFRALLEVLSELANENDRNRLAMKLFDSEGVAVTQMLAKGIGEFDRMIERADKLGITLDTKTTKEIVELNDQINIMSNTMQTVGTKALGAFAERFNFLTDQINMAKNALMVLTGQISTGGEGGALPPSADTIDTPLGPIPTSVRGAEAGAPIPTLKDPNRADQTAARLEFEQEQLERELEIFQESLMTKRELEEKDFQERLERLRVFREEGLLTERQYDKIRAQEETRQNQMRLKRSVGLFKGLTSGISQFSREAFEVNKAAGIADAVINAHIGISKTLSSYPFPINIGLAAAHGAAAFAQVNAIRSQQFNGGGGGAAPSLAGSTAAPPVSNVGPTGNGGGGDSAQSLNVNVAGFDRGQLIDPQVLVDTLNDALRDGAVIESIGLGG